MEEKRDDEVEEDKDKGDKKVTAVAASMEGMKVAPKGGCQWLKGLTNDSDEEDSDDSDGKEAAKPSGKTNATKSFNNAKSDTHGKKPDDAMDEDADDAMDDQDDN